MFITIWTLQNVRNQFIIRRNCIQLSKIVLHTWENLSVTQKHFLCTRRSRTSWKRTKPLRPFTRSSQLPVSSNRLPTQHIDSPFSWCNTNTKHDDTVSTQQHKNRQKSKRFRYETLSDPSYKTPSCCLVQCCQRKQIFPGV